MTEMYCLKCKQKVEVEAELTSKETAKGVKWMYRSKCPLCSTKMSKMTKNPKKNPNHL